MIVKIDGLVSSLYFVAGRMTVIEKIVVLNQRLFAARYKLFIISPAPMRSTTANAISLTTIALRDGDRYR
jgi:hypothetical protein